MMREYFKSPWFIALVIFAAFGWGCMVGEDSILERINEAKPKQSASCAVEKPVNLVELYGVRR